jgi:hypothetical protein
VGINGFKAYRSYWEEHPDRDEAWGESMRAQLGEDRFRREMGCISGGSVLTLKDKSGKIFQKTVNELKVMLSLSSMTTK